MQAAIGIEQLKKLPAFVEQRRDNAARFPHLSQKEVGRSSWFGFAVYGDARKHYADRYETRPIVTGNFLRQPAISYYNHVVAGPMNNANHVHNHGMMIGNSHLRIDW
jgi:CDP-6-deoxy-D-xylo-4-hexulose-3-dehydrase